MGRCRCHSRKLEKRCCGPLHGGQSAASPQALMRSRYAAYAKGLVDYIIETTDPLGDHWQDDETAWREELKAFSAQTRFEGLVILDAPPPSGDVATVTFRTTLKRNGQPVGFEEKSLFRREESRWFYVGPKTQ